MKHSILGALFVLSFAGSAPAQLFVETFTGGSNVGGWTWGAGDQIVTTGGNPGAYLRTQVLDTFAPQPRTSLGTTSEFTGNYRAPNVVEVGIDLITTSTQFPASRQLTLILDNDAGTPGNASDDFSVYTITPNLVPQPGAGWGSFNVLVPAQSVTLPANWLVLQGAGTADQVWNTVITNVSRVRWFYGDPTNFFIFDIWQVGMDNPRIVRGDLGSQYCLGDGSGTPCPCGNTSIGQGGCANSTGVGALLTASGGSTSLAANDLMFTATSLPGSAPVLLFQGTTQQNGGAGTAFGDGKRCAGGSIVRLGITQAASGAATWGPGLSHGTAMPGIRTFQAWYRNNAGPCGTLFNLTNGVELALTP